MVFQTPRHSRAGPRGRREILVSRAWRPVQAQGGWRSLRMWLSLGFSASCLILIPEWLGTLFPGCPEGLSHRHAPFFLLCDRVTSRGLLNKGGWNVQRAAVCWCHRAMGSWAAPSAPRTKWRDSTGRLGLQKDAGPGGQASGHRVHGAPAAVWAWVLLGLWSWAMPFWKQRPHFPPVQQLRVCQKTCPSPAKHKKWPLGSLPSALSRTGVAEC